MRLWRTGVALCLAGVLSCVFGCAGGSQADRRQPPAAAPKATAQAPRAETAPAVQEAAPPEPAPPVPTPQVTAGADAPGPAPGEPPKPVVIIETPPPREKTPAFPATYVWQPGDKLFLVARRFYGDGRLWPKIVEANKAIQDLVEIPAGTVLVIPAR